MSDKRHLSTVMEGDESSDSGHTILVNEAQSHDSISEAGPSTRRRRTRREGLVANGVCAAILAVLDHTLVMNRTMTVLEAADMVSAAGEQPHKLLVRVVEVQIARRELSLAQKRELFSILAWRFACVDCGRQQWADQYEDSSFLLWAPDKVPLLRSGPCLDCKRDAKSGKKKGDIVPYAA